MRTHAICTLIFAGCALGSVTSELYAAGGIVMSTHRRIAVMKTAEEVLIERHTSWKNSVADLPDPFYRPNVVVEQEPESSGNELFKEPGRPDAEVLEAVAPKIRPTGTMLIGNEQYLLLAGKRFRAGDQISVTFDGLVYRLSITSIERNSYTLRLNDEELERDFK